MSRTPTRRLDRKPPHQPDREPTRRPGGTPERAASRLSRPDQDSGRTPDLRRETAPPPSRPSRREPERRPSGASPDRRHPRDLDRDLGRTPTRAARQVRRDPPPGRRRRRRIRLQAARAIRDAALLALLAEPDLAAEDVRLLRGTQVTLAGDGRLRIRIVRGRSVTSLVLLPATSLTLLRHVEIRRVLGDDRPVFPGRHGGPLSPRQIRRIARGAQHA